MSQMAQFQWKQLLLAVAEVAVIEEPVVASEAEVEEVLEN
jgi:hypothetical protein